jgi:intein/homing endonuclease
LRWGDLGLNPWLAEKLPRVAPDVQLSFIVETPAAKLSQTLNALNTLGITPIDIAFSQFILIQAPAGLAEKIAAIENVTLHYNMPKTIYSIPFLPPPPFLPVSLTQIDPLLGEVKIPEVVIPASKPFGLPPLQLQQPNIKIIPTSISKSIIVDVTTTLTGKGVLVAVIDTGAPLPLHPQMLGRNLSMETTIPEPPIDMQGHGSWCTNCALGNPFDTRFGRVEGVATGADILHVKALSTAGFGSSFSIIKAMEIAYNRGAKVVSMSLGGELQGSIFDDPEVKVVEGLSRLGIITVIAGGNSGPDEYTIGSPGAAPSAITVAAYSITDGRVAYWSCLTGDTMIFTPNGLKQLSEIQIGDEVYSLNEESKTIAKSKVVNKINNGIRQVYEVSVAGRKIKATANHPFLAIEKENGKIIAKWKRLEELREGDAIAIVKSLPDDGRPYNISKIKRRLRNITIPSETTEDLMYFLGVYMGDGNSRIRHHGKYGKRGEIKLSIPIGDKARYKTIEAIEETFHISPKLDHHGIYLYSTSLAELIEQLGFTGNAYTKRIPAWVFTLPRTQKIAFIDGYIDSDGSRTTKVNYITSANEQLLKDTLLLCVSCGLNVSGVYAKEQKEVIFPNGHKVSGLVAYQLVIPAAQARTYSSAKSAIYHNAINFKAQTSEYLGFAVIKSIKALGMEEVYDITVEPYGNFIAEGIIVHNSRGPQGAWYKDKPDELNKAVEAYGEDALKPDCSAPGGGRAEKGAKPDELIYSGCIGWFDGFYDLLADGFEAMKGTSMATPHVAGLVALLVEGGVVKTAADVKEVLRLKGHPKTVEDGYGLIKMSMFV